MRLAIMQPYFFPYIGYFQLLHAVDRFVIYDDVNFIKKGWINRNRILVNGEPTLFSIPLQKISQNKHIRDTELSDDPKWRDKLLRMFELAYKKAPGFPAVFPRLEALIQAEYPSVAALNLASIRFVKDYLEINTDLVASSTKYDNAHLKGQERILDICLQESARTYINPTGGMELYDPSLFEGRNIELFFIQPAPTPYRQSGPVFHANLSMIDALMFLEIPDLKTRLTECRFVKK
jgi:hypothetical protein